MSWVHVNSASPVPATDGFPSVINSGPAVAATEAAINAALPVP